MAEDAASEIGSILSDFVQSGAYSGLGGLSRGIDWSHASLEEKTAVRDAYMATEQMRAASQKMKFFGYASDGIGGMNATAIVLGGGGGGAVLSHTDGETKGVGFAFGSGGAQIGGSTDFLFVGYRGRPSEFWGLFHGAFGGVHFGIGVTVITAHLGAGYASEWEALIMAVGVGAGGAVAGFVGGAWVY